MLSTIYASTGESFGITKTLEPYRNKLLEFLRLKAITFPWYEKKSSSKSSLSLMQRFYELSHKF